MGGGEGGRSGRGGSGGLRHCPFTTVPVVNRLIGAILCDLICSISFTRGWGWGGGGGGLRHCCFVQYSV